MDPEPGMKVRSKDSGGKPGRTYREVAEVGGEAVLLRTKGGDCYRISREDFDRYWMEVVE